jgi:hypothetical protein
MEIVRSTEASVNFYRTTSRHIPEDNDIQGLQAVISRKITIFKDYKPSYPGR